MPAPASESSEEEEVPSKGNKKNDLIKILPSKSANGISRSIKYSNRRKKNKSFNEKINVDKIMNTIKFRSVSRSPEKKINHLKGASMDSTDSDITE